jgi:hypothetical protein
VEKVRAEGGRRVRGAPRERARVATVESSEVSLAWAHTGIRVEKVRADEETDLGPR